VHYRVSKTGLQVVSGNFSVIIFFFFDKVRYV